MILFNIENVELIPLELRELDAWVNWVYGTKGKGRVTKIPMNPHVRGNAKSNDPQTWGSFEKALGNVEQAPEVYGLMFAFQQPLWGYFGLDLDHVGEGEDRFTMEEARGVLQRFGETYAESSPSGTGYHVIGVGEVGRGINRSRGELYGTGRFFTVTGDKAPGHPSVCKAYTAEEMAWIVAQLERGKEGTALRKGQTSPPPPVPGDAYQVPPEKLHGLMLRDRNFAAVWARTGKRYKSNSEEEMALARYMGFAQWNDTDIFAGLRLWRTLHDLDPKHPAGILATIRTLRETTLELDSSADVDKDTARQEIETFLGLRIARLVQVNKDPGLYRLHLEDRPDAIVIASAEEFVKQATWLKLALLHTGIIRASLSAKKWEQQLMRIAALKEDGDPDAATETPDETREWLSHYFDGKTRLAKSVEGVKKLLPFVENNAQHVAISQLLMHVQITFSRGITRPLLIARLQAIGWKNVRISVVDEGKQVTKNYWRTAPDALTI
jgi:hypothetical protein